VIAAEADDGACLLKQFGCRCFNLGDSFLDIKGVTTNVAGIGDLYSLEWFGVVSGMKVGTQMTRGLSDRLGPETRTGPIAGARIKGDTQYRYITIRHIT
jgi:hypothetical protein